MTVGGCCSTSFTAQAARIGTIPSLRRIPLPRTTIRGWNPVSDACRSAPTTFSRLVVSVATDMVDCCENSQRATHARDEENESEAHRAANQLQTLGQPGTAQNERGKVLVAHTGFEPVISALRGRCPWPLDECATFSSLAGDRGFEPLLTDPESVVLPLDESP